MYLLQPGKEDSVRCSAARALYSVAHEYAPIQKEIADSKGLEALVTMLGGLVRNPNEPLSIKTGAESGDTNGGKGGAKAPPPAKGGKEEPAKEEGPASSPACKQAAAEALVSVLDQNLPLQKLAALLGAIRPLVRLTGPENPVTGREWGARAIATLVQFTQNAQFVAIPENGLPPLVELCMNGNEPAQEAAAYALHNLGIADERVRIMCVTAGCLVPLVDFLKAAQSDSSKYWACQALTVFSYDKANMLTVSQSGALEALVPMLSSPNPDLRRVASRTICQVGSLLPEVQAQAGKAGALAPLIANLQHDSEAVRDAAAVALYTLVNQPDNRAVAAKAGAIEPLVKVITKGAARMAQKEREERERQLHGMPPAGLAADEVQSAVNELVDLLRRGTDGGKKDAAWGLVNISFTDYAQRAVMRAGAVPLLVNLLVYGSDRASQAAMWALWRLAANPAIRPKLADPEVVKIVTERVLRNGSPYGRIAASCALGDLASPTNPDTTLVVYGAGACNVLLKLLLGWETNTVILQRKEALGEPIERDPKPSRVKDGAAWGLLRVLRALGTAAATGEQAEALHTCRVELLAELSRDEVCSALIAILESGSLQGRQAAASLLAMLMHEVDGLSARLVSLGALEAMLAVLPKLVPDKPPPPPPTPEPAAAAPAPPQPEKAAAPAAKGKKDAPPPPVEPPPPPPPPPTVEELLVRHAQLSMVAELDPTVADVLRDCTLLLGGLVQAQPLHAKRAVELGLVPLLAGAAATAPLKNRDPHPMHVLRASLWCLWCTLSSCPVSLRACPLPAAHPSPSLARLALSAAALVVRH